MGSYIIHTQDVVRGKYHVEANSKDEALESWYSWGGDIIEEEQLSSEVTLVEETSDVHNEK